MGAPLLILLLISAFFWRWGYLNRFSLGFRISVAVIVIFVIGLGMWADSVLEHYQQRHSQAAQSVNEQK